MTRSKSSQRWLDEHFSDPFVQKAQQAGFRSRAVYKLQELQDKDGVFKPGQSVVDLGAAPGGWLQLIKQYVGLKGLVIGLDLLPIEPIDSVHCIEGDFQSDSTYEALTTLLSGHRLDGVVSDMAPNMSGDIDTDIARAYGLYELALDFAFRHLKPSGFFITKLFHGADFQPFVQSVKSSFTTVHIRKPKASRDRSRECYLVAKGFKPHTTGFSSN